MEHHQSSDTFPERLKEERRDDEHGTMHNLEAPKLHFILVRHCWILLKWIDPHREIVNEIFHEDPFKRGQRIEEPAINMLILELFFPSLPRAHPQAPPCFQIIIPLKDIRKTMVQHIVLMPPEIPADA